MSDITTPEAMREAADRLVENLRTFLSHYADKAAWDGYPATLRAMIADAETLRRALPVSEPEPLAVRVKPLSDEDRDWIDARADELFRANERRRGGIRNQTITPQDFRDYFVVTATRERILSQIEAVSVA